MRLAVIGTGYWGSKIVDTIKKMNLSVSQYDLTDNLDAIVPSIIDGVIIATPARTHMNLAKVFLRKGIDCLIEKPVFMNMAEYNELEPYTTQAKIMGGHILLYSEHYEFLKQTIVDKEILHIEHRRLNWGRIQNNITPILHYAPHDVAILDNLLGTMPDEVHCKGLNIVRQTQPDFITCNLKYNNISVQMQLGWYYHEKIRDISIITDRGTVIWNDELEYSKFISQYIEDGHQKTDTSKDRVFVSKKSSLETEIQTFINYCEKDIKPISNLQHIKRVTYIVECMEKSLKQNKIICPSKEY